MDAASPGYSAAQDFRLGGREQVRQALLAARARTLAIADAYAQALSGGGMRVPYETTLNPPLWELGHIGWFQEYWIGRNLQRPLGTACNPEHARPASLQDGADAWYDSSRVEHRSRWELALPSGQATRDYLAATLEQTLHLLDELEPQDADAALYFYRLVAAHEEMHAEAAIYMARALGIPVPSKRARPVAATGAVLRIPAQVFKLGWGGAGFAFDNELGQHEVSLDAFEIDAQPLSWTRFMPFVDAGGYRRREWWTDEGWAWLEQAGSPPQPAKTDPRTAALHLNAYEAEAWCRWAGRRLPTEAEWECASLCAPGFDWGQAWEWTASVFQPYPGFRSHPYSDYSGPWFGSRRVLRGACADTSPIIAHPRYRNFFEPQRRDVFAGFRSCA